MIFYHYKIYAPDRTLAGIGTSDEIGEICDNYAGIELKLDIRIVDEVRDRND